MKKIFIKIFLVLIILLFFYFSSVPVKKSKTNICHKKGSKYYDQTKYFKAYPTIKDCIQSGGRLPKK